MIPVGRCQTAGADRAVWKWVNQCILLSSLQVLKSDNFGESCREVIKRQLTHMETTSVE